MASGKLTMVALQAILEDRTDTKFVAALRYVTEYGYGKVAETVEHTGKDGQPIQHAVIRWGDVEIPI